MVILIETEMMKQRSMTDCGICCLAMAFQVSYEDIIERAPEYVARAAAGCRRGIYKDEIRAIVSSFGWRLSSFYKWHYEESGDFWKDYSGKMALLSVPSLNVPGLWHLVYWNGLELFDPSNMKTYTRAEIPGQAYVMALVPPENVER